jgi:hypothetical protein
MVKERISLSADARYSLGYVAPNEWHYVKPGNHLG